MRELGLRGRAPGPGATSARPWPTRRCTVRPTSSIASFVADRPEPALGGGPDLRQDPLRLGLRRLRHRRLQPLRRRLAASRPRCAVDLAIDALEMAIYATTAPGPRRTGPSLGPRRAISRNSLHRATGRGRRRRLGRIARATPTTMPWPRASTVSTRPSSSIDEGPWRNVERRRVGDAHLRRLVQQPPHPQRDRHGPAGRVRGHLLPSDAAELAGQLTDSESL